VCKDSIQDYREHLKSAQHTEAVLSDDLYLEIDFLLEEMNDTNLKKNKGKKKQLKRPKAKNNHVPIDDK
jgi:hypothetical protein